MKGNFLFTESLNPKVIPLKLCLDSLGFRKSQERLEIVDHVAQFFFSRGLPKRLYTHFQSCLKRPGNARDNIIRGKAGYHGRYLGNMAYMGNLFSYPSSCLVVILNKKPFLRRCSSGVSIVDK